MEIFVKHSLPSFAKLNRLLKALMTECQPQCTIYFPSQMECLEIKAIRRQSCIDKAAKFVHSMLNAMKIIDQILNHEIYLHIVF